MTRDLVLPVHPDCPYDAHHHPCLWCRVLTIQDSIGPAINTATNAPSSRGVGDGELKSLIKTAQKKEERRRAKS